MDAGRLDTRCAFEAASEVADGGGGVTTTWAAQFSRWGALAMPNLKGNMESIAAGAVSSTLMADLVVRSDSGTDTITTAWRLTAKGRTWNVRSVAPPVDGYIRMIIESGAPT